MNYIRYKRKIFIVVRNGEKILFLKLVKLLRIKYIFLTIRYARTETKLLINGNALHEAFLMIKSGSYEEFDELNKNYKKSNHLPN